MIFEGEYDREVFAEYGKWLPFIDIFFALCDGENGNFLHFPFPGAYMDQPSVTMLILRTIQTQYRVHLRDRMKK